MAGIAKDFIKRFALSQGFLIRRLPHGRHGDPLSDQRALLTGRSVRTILDVGSYVGETALRYRRMYPDATVHCFEPVLGSFEQLAATAARDPMLLANQLVVSDQVGPIELRVSRFAFNSSTLPASASAGTVVGADIFEEVETRRTDSTTIDSYCAEKGIDEVDLLKLDVQGGEGAALRGATEMLRKGAISVVYTEVLVAPLYQGQSGVGEILSLCEKHGYRLYGLYNFAYGPDSRFYQMDAILLSPRFAEPLIG